MDGLPTPITGFSAAIMRRGGIKSEEALCICIQRHSGSSAALREIKLVQLNVVTVLQLVVVCDLLLIFRSW
jgi:hypothetical protein